MSHINESIGNFKVLKKTESGILITAENAEAEINIFSDNIFQININKNSSAKLPKQNEKKASGSHSYAVIQKPIETKYKIAENKDKIEISTKALRLVIKKNPIRLSFYSLSASAEGNSGEGILLNEDDAFGTSWLGTEVTTYKKLQPDERFIGLGEKNGSLDRKGSRFTNWNTDHWAYPVNADPLYLSTPFFIGILKNSAYGIFLDNTHKTDFDFASANERFSSFSADDGAMNYYFIHHEKVADIISSYTWLTGRMELPPLWSLGFQQCRYSYYPESEVYTLVKTFRDKDIPCDAVYLDIHYMDDYKVFSWHPIRFPNPQKLVDDLKKKGVNLIVILDPGVKRLKGYNIYDEGTKQNHFVKFPNGDEYVGQVWPGWSCFPDFTNEKTRKWWGEKLKTLSDIGIEGFWNDMNEPTAMGKHLPNLLEFHNEGEKTTHKEAKNIYGMQMSRATYEGAKKNLKDRRPFSLTRAGFSGVQRFSAVWTGDNVSSDEHLLSGVRLLNSMGLAGIPFCGCDVGGFAGEASPELFARWIAVGAFSPLFRAHSMINTRDAEPWSFGEEVEDIARNYIKLRYRLMPYIYAAFYEASQNGLPVQRSLAIDFSNDGKIYDDSFQNQYLFGKSLLVAPITSAKDIAKIYLPEGIWFDFFTDICYDGKQEIFLDAKIDKLPLFVRGGSIIPMQGSVLHLKEKPEKVLFIHIYPGADGTFEYYEDDGSTFKYQNGFFHKRKISFQQKNKKIIFEKAEGKLDTHFKRVKIIFHGNGISTNELVINGKKIKAKTEHINFLEPSAKFDYFPLAMQEPMTIKNLKTIEFDNSTDKIIVEWE